MRYRPTETVEAIQLRHDRTVDRMDILDWVVMHGGRAEVWLDRVDVHTVGGVVPVKKGEYVVRDIRGFRVCSAKEFEEAYEAVNDGPAGAG